MGATALQHRGSTQQHCGGCRAPQPRAPPQSSSAALSTRHELPLSSLEPDLVPYPHTWQQEPFCTYLCPGCPVVLAVPQGSGAGPWGPLGARAAPARHTLAVELQDACGNALDVQQVIQASEALQLLWREVSPAQNRIPPAPRAPCPSGPVGKSHSAVKGGQQPKAASWGRSTVPPDELDRERGCSSRAGEQLDTHRCTYTRHPLSRGTPGTARPRSGISCLPSPYTAPGAPSRGGIQRAGLCWGRTRQTASPGRARLALLTRQGSSDGAAAAPRKGLQ